MTAASATSAASVAAPAAQPQPLALPSEFTGPLAGETFEQNARLDRPVCTTHEKTT